MENVDRTVFKIAMGDNRPVRPVVDVDVILYVHGVLGSNDMNHSPEHAGLLVYDVLRMPTIRLKYGRYA